MNKRFLDASVFFYCFLLILSCMSGLFLDLSSFKIVGLIGLVWAILSLLVFLWVVERVFYFKKQIKNKNSAGLPHRILSSMQRHRSYNQGVKAVRSFNSANVYVLICGTLYCLWMLYAAMNPLSSPELSALDAMIEGFFKDEGQEPLLFFDFNPLVTAALNITYLMIIFLCFWLIQLYVYSHSAFWNISWLALALFFLSFFSMFGPGSSVSHFHIPSITLPGYGWNNMDVLQALDVIPQERLSYFQQRIYASGIAGAVLMYLPGLVVALIMMRNMFSKSVDKRLPLIGIMVLLVMVYIDLFFAAQPRQFALWLSGWCVLGIVSVRGRSDMRKIYRIHQ